MSAAIQADIIPAIGEVHIDADGVVSGWCASLSRPTERLTVEILINDTVVGTATASRFMEDVRSRGIGDGYYGFSVTLTRQLNALGHSGIVSVREAASQHCFWHWVRGAFPLPEGLEDRVVAARQRLGWLGAAVAAAPPSADALLGPAFAALGRHLSAPAAAMPHLATGGRAAFSVVAPAEVTGTAPDCAELVLFGNTTGHRSAHTVLHLPGDNLGMQRRRAMAAATGAHLVLCGAPLPFTTSLEALPGGVVIAHDLGHALSRLVPSFNAWHLPPGTAAGVLLAVPRAIYASLGGLAADLDEGGDLAIADFALRAAAAGHDVAIGGDEATGGAVPPSTDAAAWFMAHWQTDRA